MSMHSNKTIKNSYEKMFKYYLLNYIQCITLVMDYELQVIYYDLRDYSYKNWN